MYFSLLSIISFNSKRKDVTPFHKEKKSPCASVQNSIASRFSSKNIPGKEYERKRKSSEFSDAIHALFLLSAQKNIIYEENMKDLHHQGDNLIEMTKS